MPLLLDLPIELVEKIVAEAVAPESNKDGPRLRYSDRSGRRLAQIMLNFAINKQLSQIAFHTFFQTNPVTAIIELRCEKHVLSEDGRPICKPDGAIALESIHLHHHGLFYMNLRKLDVVLWQERSMAATEDSASKCVVKEVGKLLWRCHKVVDLGVYLRRGSVTFEENVRCGVEEEINSLPGDRKKAIRLVIHR